MVSQENLQNTLKNLLELFYVKMILNKCFLYVKNIIRNILCQNDIKQKFFIRYATPVSKIEYKVGDLSSQQKKISRLL